MTWLPLVLSGAGILVALLSLLRTFVVAHQDQSGKMTATLAALDSRCTLLEMKIGMFWRLVEENLSGLLKRPTHFEMDGLLDKLREHTITLDECYRLQALLRHAYLSPGSTVPTERIVVILVLGAVQSLIHELEHTP